MSARFIHLTDKNDRAVSIRWDSVKTVFTNPFDATMVMADTGQCFEVRETTDAVKALLRIEEMKARTEPAQAVAREVGK